MPFPRPPCSLVKPGVIRRSPNFACSYSLFSRGRGSSSSKQPFFQQGRRPLSDMAAPNFVLTPGETRLRELLLDVAKHIDQSKIIKENIELRFAGGWVRDKLLDIPSHDIDTAINAMTGFEFAMKMKEYLENEENVKKHNVVGHDIGTLHKIVANPEKSKHLETATTRIFGFDVDFVNLRKETYSEDSRNPQMEFGTAEEDAIRRDATINALFYNLNSDELEDFTGGLKDMEKKLIRTPMEPKQTFMDDPLRVLRLIRFASRLSFTIDPAAQKQMRDTLVQKALEQKISRERVGVEVEKMFKGNNPKSSLEYFDQLGLYGTIFTVPQFADLPIPNTENLKAVYNCLDELRKNETPGSIYQSLVRSGDANYIAWILAALVPWSATPGTGFKLPKNMLLGAMVAREGIKADNKITSLVNGAFKHYEQIIQLKDAIREKETWINQRDTVGMSIRRWESQGGHWRLQALFSLLVQILNNDPSSGFEEVFTEWQAFIDHVESMELMDAPTFKSIVDGTMLVKALGAKPGPWTKAALDVCMEWQLRNPGATNPQGAIDDVKARSVELKIPIAK